MFRNRPKESSIAEETFRAKLQCEANLFRDPGIKADGPLIEHMDGSHDDVYVGFIGNRDKNPELLGGS